MEFYESLEINLEPQSEIKEILETCNSLSQRIDKLCPILLTDFELKGFDRRDLLRQIFLHIPRQSELKYATDQDLIQITEEFHFLLTNSFQENRISIPKKNESLSLFDLEYQNLRTDEVATLMNNLHYLRAHRKDSVARGLKKFNYISVAATLSPFDLDNCAEYLPEDVERSDVVVLSRVLAFNWTPRNAVSFLFSKLYSDLAKQNKKFLVTYINPNLGFDGASVRSSGWWPFVYEYKPFYLYLDNKYVTERYCIENFGSSAFSTLREKLGNRIKKSQGELAPLILYGFHLLRNEKFRQADRNIPIVASSFKH